MSLIYTKAGWIFSIPPFSLTIHNSHNQIIIIKRPQPAAIHFIHRKYYGNNGRLLLTINRYANRLEQNLISFVTHKKTKL